MGKPHDVELDKILREIGQFGRYQFHVYRFVLPVIIFNAFFKTQYIFNARGLHYRRHNFGSSRVKLSVRQECHGHGTVPSPFNWSVSG
ncbi:unnamed protein product [Leptosia nina]|uniref:Uncharacterized protein n=1 Tax=Leptosia nina TaxID=320188 RepID=A0AAV1K2G8_9NEOP